MDGRQKSAEILRALRRRNDLTQRDLARVAEVPQPTIAAIESGQREPSLSLLSRIVESAGYGVRLDLVPLARFGVVNVARQIERLKREHIDNDRSEDSALRLTLSFRDVLRGKDDRAARDLVDGPPNTTGSLRWDAILAAVVEEECARRDIGPPRWVNERSRFLKPFWHLSKNPRLHEWEFATAPAAYLRHGVVVAAEELASV